MPSVQAGGAGTEHLEPDAYVAGRPAPEQQQQQQRPEAELQPVPEDGEDFADLEGGMTARSAGTEARPAAAGGRARRRGGALAISVRGSISARSGAMGRLRASAGGAAALQQLRRSVQLPATQQEMQ